jgi:vancomycin resistance protein YoaR
VSGTLYNAVLLANLKVKHRENHSMPVAYLPVGRDATVDYGTKDLRFENSTDHPIAIYSSYVTGRLTFGVLGLKEPGLSVEIVTSGHKSWSRGIQYVTDKTLPPGKTKVVEKGASGHQIDTYRVVKKDGVEVKREYLGRSHYAGGVRIIARGPAAAVPTPGPVNVPPPATGGVG